MRPVGLGGVLDGNASLAGLPVTSAFHTLSAVCSGKILVFISSPSYNTLFLSSLGFMVTQYAPSGV